MAALAREPKTCFRVACNAAGFAGRLSRVAASALRAQETPLWARNEGFAIVPKAMHVIVLKSMAAQKGRAGGRADDDCGDFFLQATEILSCFPVIESGKRGGRGWVHYPLVHFNITGSRETRGLSRLVIPAVVAYVVCMYRVRARLFATFTVHEFQVTIHSLAPHTS